MCCFNDLIEWLKENQWLITVIIIPVVGLIGFIIKSRREKKLHYAAKIQMELSLEGYQNAQYILTVYNEGNSANNLVIKSDTLGFSKYEATDFGIYENTYPIGLLKKGDTLKVKANTDLYPGLTFFVTAQWSDDFKKKNEKKFCVWKGDEQS